MHLHILGICGTFMGGVAMIARQQGHQVTGSDEAVYPPMSTMLEEAGIEVIAGYDPQHLPPSIDQVIVGNVIRRGNPMLEAVLSRSIPYLSGPEWLYQSVLVNRQVLAVAGTHGKTTVSSLLAWLLRAAGLECGYLIGGVAKNFATTAHLGQEPYFVIEADEYDTAFFDKRSKFLHYRPRTLVINNLEFDHADIFANLAMIQKQFSTLLRLVPENGSIIRPQDDAALDPVFAAGCWSPVETFGRRALQEAADWSIETIDDGGRTFTFSHAGQNYEVNWPLYGVHNVANAVAAVAASHQVGVSVETAVAALATFKGVKRRLECYGTVNEITLYDDFAHHPTAIKATLTALRAQVKGRRIVAILQFASNTMREGKHPHTLLQEALMLADKVVMLEPASTAWNLSTLVESLAGRASTYPSVEQLLDAVVPQLKQQDQVILMSNKNFSGLQLQLEARLAARTTREE